MKETTGKKKYMQQQMQILQHSLQRAMYSLSEFFELIWNCSDGCCCNPNLHFLLLKGHTSHPRRFFLHMQHNQEQIEKWVFGWDLRKGKR
jgi:hypothetical protein